MMVSFVAAASENNVIGYKNRLPWHLPNDLKFFKNTTWAMPVIMGRKTFESFGKALRGRRNIVITRQDNWKADGAIVVKNIDDGLKVARETDTNEAFIIGGGEIFRQSMPLANKIFLTRVHAAFEGDAFFPVIDEKEWHMKSNLNFDTDELHQYAYSFQLWQRHV